MPHLRKINLSQAHILRRLRYFKKLRYPTHPRSQYKHGHCEGLTATFLYGKWVSLNQHPRIQQESERWFVQNLKDLSKFNANKLFSKQTHNINTFSKKLHYFQYPNYTKKHYRQGEYHITMTNELGHKPKLEYSLVGSFKPGDLNKPNYYKINSNQGKTTTPLAILSQPYRLVHISCYQHATGLIADENHNIYFYDANNPKGPVKFNAFNINELESKIFRSHHYRHEAVLAFRCFHFDKDTITIKEAMYPEQEQILKNLSGNMLTQSPIDPTEWCSPIYLAKHINCQKSYQFYKSYFQNTCLSPNVPAASGPSAPEI